MTTPCWYGVDAAGAHLHLDGRRQPPAPPPPGEPARRAHGPRDNWYSHVSIVGRAVELRPDPDLADIDALSQHYEGVAYDDREYRGVTAFIEIERWHTWGDPAGEA